MTGHDAFLSEIRSDPESDIPRLIYADWLDDRGDPRGELIRVQCELHRLRRRGRRFRTLKIRESELLAAHREKWLPPLPSLGPTEKYFNSELQFRRGLVEHLSFRSILPLDEVFSQFPICSIGFDWAAYSKFKDPYLRQDHPWLPQIQEVSCTTWWKTQTVAKYFWAQTPLFPNLRSASCTRGAAIRFLDNCPSLQRLDLDETDLAGRGMTQLAQRNLAKIRSLSLRKNNLTHAELAALAGADLSQLQSLTLSDNPLGSAGASVLARVDWPLEELTLGNNDFGDQEATLLANSDLFVGLKRLTFVRGNLTAQGVQAIADSPALSDLEELHLSFNSLGDEGFRLLLESPNLTNLRYLSVGFCELTDASAAALSGVALNLVDLDLMGNQLTSDGAVSLARTAFPELRSLQLTGNDIGEVGFAALLHQADWIEAMDYLGVYANPFHDPAQREYFRERFGMMFETA